MKAAGPYALAAIVGIVLGALSVKPVLLTIIDRLAIRSGPWQTLPGIGSGSANPYVRSAVAVAGLYALSARETIYYTAFLDSAGRTLEGRCSYRVEGPAPAARWWSFTVYGDDNYLVENADGIHSIAMNRLPVDGAGGIAFEVGPQRGSGHWVPSPQTGPYSITVRLYNPAPAVASDRAAARLPAIRRLSCGGGAT